MENQHSAQSFDTKPLGFITTWQWSFILGTTRYTHYIEKISVFFVVIEMNRNLRNECLLLCTWTMRGVLENLNSKKKKIEKISLSLRLNSKSLCHFQRVRAENETTNCWRDQIVCALHVNYLFFTIYSIYLLCLSCFFFFSLLEPFKRDSNIHFQSVLFIDHGSL